MEERSTMLEEVVPDSIEEVMVGFITGGAMVSVVKVMEVNCCYLMAP